MDEIAPGLWRWTALHPDWVPDSEPGGSDDWEQRVGSVLHTTSDAAVFIDPLVPARATAFWRWADATGWVAVNCKQSYYAAPFI